MKDYDSFIYEAEGFMTRLKTDTRQLNIVDLLCTEPVQLSFTERVKGFGFSPDFEQKIVSRLECTNPLATVEHMELTPSEEQELAVEVLKKRHTFTCLLLKNPTFQQAALSIVQNIYLFRQRRIFFDRYPSTEKERQAAIKLFSNPDSLKSGVELGQTLQHLVLARIWARITGQGDEQLTLDRDFLELQMVVAGLNSLRNIYMLFSTRLMDYMARKASPLYRQALSYEDAVQVAGFGVARAAYRYHHSFGVSFNSYASNWIKKELQRQGLSNRLVKIPSHLVERYAREQRLGLEGECSEAGELLKNAIYIDDNNLMDYLHQGTLEASGESPTKKLEQEQSLDLLGKLVAETLSPRLRDLIQRRFGLPPHKEPQSIIEIARLYGVTRGRIYQLERDSLKKLKNAYSSLVTGSTVHR